MFEVKSSSSRTFKADVRSAAEVFIPDAAHQPDIVKIGEGEWHIIIDGHSHVVSLVKEDRENNQVVLNIDGVVQTYEVKDQNQLLLEKMGLASMTKKKIKDLKAPMPGLVVRILAEKGQEVTKGTPLLVLEAMKMENIIKAPDEAVVKNIPVNQGDAVEKNHVLVNFEG